MSVDVALATSGDRAAVLELVRAALGEVATHRGGTAYLHDLQRALGARTADEAVDRLLAQRDGWTLVLATIDGVVTGLVLRRDADGARRVWACYVDSSTRERGCGTALFDEALTAPRGRDVLTFESLALPGDRATKSAGERVGAKARLLVLAKPFEADSYSGTTA